LQSKSQPSDFDGSNQKYMEKAPPKVEISSALQKQGISFENFGASTNKTVKAEKSRTFISQPQNSDSNQREDFAQSENIAGLSTKKVNDTPNRPGGLAPLGGLRSSLQPLQGRLDH
jgi:hypothetical protein